MNKNLSIKKPSSLTKWIYDFLKEKILNLEYKPGQQLHIDEFAEKLEVSRTPIRETFLKLANEGLLEIKPHVGYFVNEISEQDIKDLFEIREMVEKLAARNAAEWLTDIELKYLKNILDEASNAVADKDLEKYIENDIKFHNSLQKHIHNKRMHAFMESLNDLTYRERIISMKSEENVKLTVVEHQRILDALIKHDADLAEWLMGEHLNNVSQRIIKFLKEESIFE